MAVHEKVFPVATGNKKHKERLVAHRQLARAGVDVPQPHAVHQLPQRVVGIRDGWRFTAQQLNRTPLFGGGTAPNQLIGLTQQGYAKRVGADDKELPPFDSESVKKEPALAPLNSEAPLEARGAELFACELKKCALSTGSAGAAGRWYSNSMFRSR